jgi:hypothetical protein
MLTHPPAYVVNVNYQSFLENQIVKNLNAKL